MDINKAAAAMGSIGGKNGTGESKRRGTEHYKRIAKLRWKNTPRPISERFWEKVEKRGPDECWPWIACKNKLGYGLFPVNKKTHNAHRTAYELHYGVKVKYCVLHRCDNPTCCNPHHLFEGTHLENMQDKSRKGREAKLKGELNGHSKLTELDVVKIRADPRPHRVIADEYGGTKTMVAWVKNRKSWKHIP